MSGALNRSLTRPSTARKLDDDDSCVKVAVNVRPLIDIELAAGCQEAIVVEPGHPQVTLGPHTYTYDSIYGCGGDELQQLYPACVQPLVDGLFKGYNATVLAYGQTGSGKTYTMGSGFTPGEQASGVIPQVMEELFSRVTHTQGIDFTVRVSFVEIHKEDVRDLLFTDNHAPRPVVTIREMPSGVSLAGAVEREVHSQEEMALLLEQGSVCRAVASTNMNNRSSRSHAIFTITLEQRKQLPLRPSSDGVALGERGGASSEEESEGEEGIDDAADDYLIAKMHLVDLAGSERAKRTGAEGARLKEAININKGLLALAKVISALVDNHNHVPYRDSKLTRLLQDSLGGNSRTVMIACVSPADINREETLNTLRYADRARHIKNKPVVNRDPVAAQVAALRQQAAQLRAENTALRRALGGDAAVAAALAAGTLPPSEALQEAYDELSVRHDMMETEFTKNKMELDAVRAELDELRGNLLTAEIQRDTHLLHLQRLQKAVAESTDENVKQIAAEEQAAAARAAAPNPAADGTHADPEVDIIATLRARVTELEQEARQVKMLHRMTTNVLSRSNSIAPSRLASWSGRQSGLSHLGGLPGIASVGHGEDSVPMTPTARISDTADHPLMASEAEGDADLIASTTAHLMGQEQLKLQLAALGRQMHAKQQRLVALQQAVGGEGLRKEYNAQMKSLQAERDTLIKEKNALMQKLQAAAQASMEERKRLEHQYKDKILAVERRVRELGEKEREYKRTAKHFSQIEQVVEQLNRDIARMKSQKAGFQKSMEQKEKEFREWRIQREREVMQLRRNQQRANAQLQEHVNMHAKQQAVLKRKTEEAEAARKRIRELLELQQRNRTHRSEATTGVEIQPNAGAPLLRNENARRQWLEQELDMCNTSWEYQKVLDGELAQRAAKTRKLREVQKQMMLLGGLVPPSPLVTQLSLLPSTPGNSQNDTMQEKQWKLKQDIEKHSEAVKEWQNQWERAKQEEESRGAGAADVKRWTGVRTIVEARELLRSLFRLASDSRAQVHECHLELARQSEEMDILCIQLDMAQQQVQELKRKAAKAEATVSVVMASPCHIGPEPLMMEVAGGRDETDIAADDIITSLGLELPEVSVGMRSSDRGTSGGGRSPLGLDVGGHHAASSSAAPGQGPGGPSGGTARPSNLDAGSRGSGFSGVTQFRGTLAADAGLMRLDYMPSSSGGGRQPVAASRGSSGGGVSQEQLEKTYQSLEQEFAQLQAKPGRRSHGQLSSAGGVAAERSSMAGSSGRVVAGKERNSRGGFDSWGGARDGGPSRPKSPGSSGGSNLRPGSRSGSKPSSPEPDAAIAQRKGPGGKGQQQPRHRLGSGRALGIGSGGEVEADPSSDEGSREALRKKVLGSPVNVDEVAKELDFQDAALKGRPRRRTTSTRHSPLFEDDDDDDDADDEDAVEVDEDTDADEDDVDDDPDYVMSELVKRKSRSRTSKVRLSGESPDEGGLAAEKSSSSVLSGGRSGRNLKVSQLSQPKRLEWERPVFDHINLCLTNEGKQPKDRLTVEVLKEALAGRVPKGKRVRLAKTRDHLIMQYRAHLGLDPEGDGQEPAELDRLTGSVSWPGGPGEQPPTSTSSAAVAGGFDTGNVTKLQLSRLAAASLPFSCSSAPGSPMAHGRKSSAFADTPVSLRRAASANGSPSSSPEPEGRGSMAGVRAALAGAQRVGALRRVQSSRSRRASAVSKSIDLGAPSRIMSDHGAAGLTQQPMRAAVANSNGAANAARASQQGSLRVSIPPGGFQDGPLTEREGVTSKASNNGSLSSRVSHTAWRC